ncbi:MAG: AMP-binding protein [Candidatus Helarchaeota archaeon]|nr:AMP-binding protein [Candidatus Helarchaeota archaeon]
MAYDERFWTKSYDDHVQPSLKYPKESLGKLFDDGMAKFPEKTACWLMKREISFGELRDMTHRFATFLQANGLKKGDAVAINLPNSPQYLAAHFGTILAGGAASGCSPLLSADEIAYQINDSESKFLITIDKVYEKVLKEKGVLDKTPKLETIITTNISEYMGLSGFVVLLGKLLGKIPKGKVKPHPGKKVVWFKEVMKTPPNVKEVAIDVDNDLALLQYTGGTTGRPKGTELTHANIIANMEQSRQWMDLAPGTEIAESAFPLFHLAGLIFCMVSVYLSNAQVLIPDPRNYAHFIEEMIAKKPTLIANVPTLYINLQNDPKRETIPKEVLDNMKIYLSGAAPFPAEAILNFEKAFQANGKVLEVFGMTETSPLVTMNPRVKQKKVGTVGLPLQDTELRIVDLETGKQVELGKPGEIIVKGPQVTRGYYKKPEATKNTIIDGWLHTGDVGVMDEDGYVKIVDRTKDMLIVSGFKVYSVHVEDILDKQPDIELAAIIGLKDPNRPGSEIVKAVLKLKKGIQPTEDVKARIKAYAEQNLSKYEVPKVWEFRAELPTTLVGKVLKRELREAPKP